MTAQAPATDLWSDTYESLRPALPGTARLSALREAAFEGFRASGFPTQREEDWQYTSVALVSGSAFRPAPTPTADELARAGGLLESLPPVAEDGVRLVFVNGHPAPALSTTEALAEGVELVGLADALANGSDVQERLGSLVNGAGHAFQALNTALFEDGVLLRVRAGLVATTPLHLVFLLVGSGQFTAVHPRLLLVVEDGAEVALVESWIGEAGADGFSNTVVEAFVGANARLDMLEVQEQDDRTLHFRTLHVRQARDSRFSCTCFTRGARLARNDVHIRLAAPGAECRLDGLTLADGEQHADHQTKIDHAEPHGTSHQLYKGILDDRATVAFSGRVLVEVNAQKTDARQANHNILLSPDAVADSKPQLEIFADDVKCAHGSTVGQLDDDALFYLRSRGIGTEAARRLLLKAFAAEVTERIEHEALRAHAEALLERRLPGGV